MRWLSGRAPGAASEDAADGARADPMELSVVDLVTRSGRRLAWIETDGRRTSDWLNTAGETLPLRQGMAIALDALDAEAPAADPAAPEDPLPAEDVLLIVPPPLPPNRHLRLHRRRVHVEVTIGAFVVSGQAHVRPGAQVGDHIFRSGRRFVPLTDVELTHRAEPAFMWQLPCVILNASHVEEVRGIEPARVAAPEPQLLQQPEAPAPAVAATPPVPEPAATAAEPESAELEPIEPESAEPQVSRNAILLTALELLLAEGVIDVVEFQTKRATLLRE